VIESGSEGQVLAFRITGDCIECKACLEACEYQAIFHVRSPDAHPCFTIDPSACSHCWPFDQHPRCVNVCPIECIVIDAECPTPPLQLIREELGKVLAVAGSYEAARTVAQLRRWVREWAVGLLGDGTAAVDLDKVLDFYNRLCLIEREFLSVEG
jgi:ferredoxin